LYIFWLGCRFFSILNYSKSFRQSIFYGRFPMLNNSFANDAHTPFPPPYCDGNAQFYFASTVQVFSQLGVPGWFGMGSRTLKLELPAFAQEGMVGDDQSAGKHCCFSVHSQYLDDNPALFKQTLAAIHALGPQQLSAGFESLLDLSGHIVCVIKDSRASPDVGAFHVEFNGFDREDISGALSVVSNALFTQAAGNLVFIDEAELPAAANTQENGSEEDDPPTALFGEACTVQGSHLILEIEEYERIAENDEWHDVRYRIELDRLEFLNALQRVLLRVDHQLEQLSKAWATVTKID
jgi:hypothetical protein